MIFKSRPYGDNKTRYLTSLEYVRILNEIYDKHQTHY